MIDTSAMRPISARIPSSPRIRIAFASDCARSRRHSIAELTAKIERLLDAYR